MARIHPTAIVESGAAIADDAEIGPYCVIGPQVTIGNGCKLVSHVHVSGVTSIGARTKIAPFCSLGTPPQSTRYRGGATRLVIGEDCDLREAVTMNTGTEDGGGVTTVGNKGLFMVSSHVGHDCHVGNGVTFANAATLGGHCTIGDNVVMGGLSAIHQHVRIGTGAMVAGVTGVRADVIPFGLVIGAIGRLGGLNLIGLKRKGFSRQSINTVRAAYKKLFFGPELFKVRFEAMAAEYGGDAAVSVIIDFIRDHTDRSLCQPGGHHED
ncbi:MAG: acyl-ACP--UDP-N-acetylglucosamine O-acyltransferase [Pseudorhodoplanes sp.]